jgi:hypothetical protein
MAILEKGWQVKKCSGSVKNRSILDDAFIMAAIVQIQETGSERLGYEQFE